jgi:hypothetical protein
LLLIDYTLHAIASLSSFVTYLIGRTQLPATDKKNKMPRTIASASKCTGGSAKRELLKRPATDDHRDVPMNQPSTADLKLHVRAVAIDAQEKIE